MYRDYFKWVIKIAKKQTKQEKSESSKLGKALIITCTIAMVAIFAIVVGLLSAPVEMEMEGTCNTGSLGLDVGSENFVQSYPCTEEVWNVNNQSTYRVRDPDNLTCFKEDLLMSHARIQGIQDLECTGKVKTKMPFILAMIVGGFN